VRVPQRGLALCNGAAFTNFGERKARQELFSLSGPRTAIGEMLIYWYSATQHDNWTTRLEEYVSKVPGPPDRILIQKGI